MGDKILKKLAYIITLSTFVFAQAQPQTQTKDDDLSWVDEQIESIKPKRVGIAPKYISLLKDPFIFLEKNKTKKKDKGKTRYTRSRVIPPSILPRPTVSKTSTNSKKVVKKRTKKLELSAIINDTALIAGKWYKLGDSVRGYKITKITLTDVILERKGGKKITLTTKTKIK
jgi:hypothetical protein